MTIIRFLENVHFILLFNKNCIYFRYNSSEYNTVAPLLHFFILCFFFFLFLRQASSSTFFKFLESPSHYKYVQYAKGSDCKQQKM